MTAIQNQRSYISTKEAAAFAKVHISTIRRWIHARLFSYRRKNRNGFEVDDADFKRFITELTAPVSQSTT